MIAERKSFYAPQLNLLQTQEQLERGFEGERNCEIALCDDRLSWLIEEVRKTRRETDSDHTAVDFYVYLAGTGAQIMVDAKFSWYGVKQFIEWPDGNGTIQGRYKNRRIALKCGRESTRNIQAQFITHVIKMNWYLQDIGGISVLKAA